MNFFFKTIFGTWGIYQCFLLCVTHRFFVNFDQHQTYISGCSYDLTRMSTYCATLVPRVIDGEIVYTNFATSGKKAPGMPRARNPPSQKLVDRRKLVVDNFNAYINTGVLVGDVKIITSGMKAKNKKNFQEKFECKHACPNIKNGDTTDEQSYGINWKALNPSNDYIFSCDRHNDSMYSAECNTLMFSCHSACPFTRFKETVAFSLPWTNPVLFHSSGSDSNMQISISDHTDTTWHRFWRAVHLKSTAEYSPTEMDRYKIKTSFARIRYMFALNAVLNYIAVDGKEVDCEVNMYIRLNGDKFKSAATFLQQRDNTWRREVVEIDYFDRLFNEGMNMGNVSAVLREENKILSLAHKQSICCETIRNIYQLYGLTKTAQKSANDFHLEPKRYHQPTLGSSIINNMYSLSPATDPGKLLFDTQHETKKAAQTLMSIREFPFTSHDDSETEHAVDMLMALSKHR